MARYIFSFPPRFSLGTASGEFPRPAASRRLLFRLLPRNLLKPRRRFACAPPEKPSLALGVVSSRLLVPQEKGAKKEKQNVSEFDPNHRLPRERSGATPSPRQRRCVHRSFGRYAAVMEERAGRVGSKTEWHRVVAWNGLGERVAAALRKGDHVLVEGTLVSRPTTANTAKARRPRVVKHTVWQIRA